LCLFYLWRQFWQESNRMTFNFKHSGILNSQLVLLYGSREFIQTIDDEYRAHLGRNMYTKSMSFFCYLLFLFSSNCTVILSSSLFIFILFLLCFLYHLPFLSNSFLFFTF
jgi:hypothetical protein